MKINKEGYKIITVSGVCLAALWTLAYYMVEAHEHMWLLILLSLMFLMLWFFIVSFFREPRRIKIHDDDLVFSPCDGRVVVTEIVEDSEYFHGKRLQVSIFMSVTNVHINWFPVGGVVKYFKYHPGRFLVAWHPKSSTDNERTTTVVQTRKGVEVLFRQIAGFVARRIVSYVKVDEQVHQNDKCGFIKFGSRIDILLPTNAELLVEIGDRVVGTQTPIARIGDFGVEDSDNNIDE
ncbi:MAG: phosphatidylserine decarboxylase family protein [Alistipes sp.]|nr:phosphatidylserine decarboxylase family protein [Alistipes sp.]